MDQLNGDFYPDPKPRKRIVDKKYLRFLTTKFCLYCGEPALEPHHVRKGYGDGKGSLSRKPDDHRAIRTCYKCHNALEGKDKYRLEWMKKERKWEDVYSDMVDNLIEYFN